MLALLAEVTQQNWSVSDGVQNIVYPKPGRPVREHHSQWQLVCNNEVSGIFSGVVEEGGLNMVNSSFTVMSVNAELSTGIRINGRQDERDLPCRSCLRLTATGVSDEDLQQAINGTSLKWRWVLEED